MDANPRRRLESKRRRKERERARQKSLGAPDIKPNTGSDTTAIEHKDTVINLGLPHHPSNQAIMSCHKTSRPSPLLILPRELRQRILSQSWTFDYVPSDHDIARHALRLEQVCTELQSDVFWVRQEWHRAAEAVLEAQALERGAFNDFIAELMAPISAATGLFAQRSHIGRAQDWDVRTSRDVEKRKTRRSTLPSHVKVGEAGQRATWTAEKGAEAEEIRTWQRIREQAQKRVKAMGRERAKRKLWSKVEKRQAEIKKKRDGMRWDSWELRREAVERRCAEILAYDRADGSD